MKRFLVLITAVIMVSTMVVFGFQSVLPTISSAADLQKLQPLTAAAMDGGQPPGVTPTATEPLDDPVPLNGIRPNSNIPIYTMVVDSSEHIIGYFVPGIGVISAGPFTIAMLSEYKQIVPASARQYIDPAIWAELQFFYQSVTY